MKRFLLITLLLFLPIGWLLMAQSSFAVKKVFDGKVLGSKAVVETMISGRQLASYHLDSFHSLRYSAGEEEAAVVEELVLADDGTTATLVYMYGSATLDELKNIFKTR